MASFSSSFNRFRGTALGKYAQQGVAESFGWKYGISGSSHGFLGLKDPGYLKSISGTTGLKRVGKTLGQTISSGWGLVYTAMSAYSGWQEGGLTGAIKGAGGAVIENTLINMALRSAGNPVLLGATAVAAAGYGVYRYGKAAGEYGRSIKRLEMGAPFVDTFGTAATMRQRSLAALQNSHVNGRMALGNEASLMHNPMMR